MSKAQLDSTFYQVEFDDGEVWEVGRYQYLKLLQLLLTEKQLFHSMEVDGKYIISNKRYLKAKEYYIKTKDNE